MAYKCVLHVGFAKCASSTLQRALFEGHPQINNVGKPYDSRSDVHKLMGYVYQTPYGLFDATHAAELLDQCIEKYWSSSMVNVLSDERLTNADGSDVSLTAERLASLFPEAMILFVIRRPLDYLASLYTHRYSKRQISVSFDEWVELYAHNSHNDPVHRANYHSTIQHFVESFGRRNVRVAIFEELATDMQSFVASICDFVGVTPNAMLPIVAGKAPNKMRRISAAQRFKLSSPLLQRFDAFAKRSLPPSLLDLGRVIIRSGPRATPKLSQEWQCYVEEQCREGNHALVDEFELPLKEYGYPL